MALIHTNVTIGTSATLLLKLPAGLPPTIVSVGNNHSALIYVGGSTVTAAGPKQGNLIAVSQTLPFTLHGGDELYAVTTAVTAAGAITLIYSGV